MLKSIFLKQISYVIIQRLALFTNKNILVNRAESLINKGVSLCQKTKSFIYMMRPKK